MIKQNKQTSILLSICSRAGCERPFHFSNHKHTICVFWFYLVLPIPEGASWWDTKSKENFEFKEAVHRWETIFLSTFQQILTSKCFFIANFYNLIHMFREINKYKTL